LLLFSGSSFAASVSSSYTCVQGHEQEATAKLQTYATQRSPFSRRFPARAREAGADTKGDYSACVVLLRRREVFFVLEVIRERLRFDELRRKILEVKKRYGDATLLIEDSPISKGLIQSLEESSLNVTKYAPDTDKRSRLFAQCDRFAGGSVRLPKRAALAIPANPSARLTEERAGGPKSAFHFDVQGSVAKSTHTEEFGAAGAETAHLAGRNGSLLLLVAPHSYLPATYPIRGRSRGK
jgi:phage terminase large subunit-like protein